VLASLRAGTPRDPDALIKHTATTAPRIGTPTSLLDGVDGDTGDWPMRSKNAE